MARYEVSNHDTSRLGHNDEILLDVIDELGDDATLENIEASYELREDSTSQGVIKSRIDSLTGRGYITGYHT